MKRMLLATVATAALIVGLGAASAQMGGSGGGTGGNQPGAQNSPSGGSGSGSSAPRGEEQMKSGVHEKEPGASVQREQKEKSKIGQSQNSQGEKVGQGAQEKTRKEGQTEPRGNNREKMGRDEEHEKGGNRERMGRDEEKSRMQQGQGQTEQKERTTTQTQQGTGSGKSVQLSSEQRTRIQTTLKSQTNIARVNRSSFHGDIRVGVRVPTSIHVDVLPATIVEIVPQYRGYKYVLVEDEILILDPTTLEIVAIIPA